MGRGSPFRSQLSHSVTRWDRGPSLPRVALALYAQLPEDARLWLRKSEFVVADRERLVKVLEVA